MQARESCVSARTERTSPHVPGGGGGLREPRREKMGSEELIRAVGAAGRVPQREQPDVRAGEHAGSLAHLRRGGVEGVTRRVSVRAADARGDGKG